MNLFTIGCLYFTAKAQMIFYIPAAHSSIGSTGAFKFTEYLFIGFTHDISQYVQPAPVRHTYCHFLNIIICSCGNNCIQCCNSGFSSFQAKTFLPDIFSV